MYIEQDRCIGLKKICTQVISLRIKASFQYLSKPASVALLLSIATYILGVLYDILI